MAEADGETEADNLLTCPDVAVGVTELIETLTFLIVVPMLLLMLPKISTAVYMKVVQTVH